MDEVVEIYKNGDGWVENAVAVTFDDGFQNNYLYAADILDSYKVPATFYIVQVWSIQSYVLGRYNRRLY